MSSLMANGEHIPTGEALKGAPDQTRRGISGTYLSQAAVQVSAHQQRGAEHHGDKTAHAVPAVVMPEYPAERTGDAGAKVVAEQIQ